MEETQWATAQALRRAAKRFAVLAVEANLARLRFALKAGFRPDQPRVPSGNPQGGRWTDGAIPVTSRNPRGGPPRRVAGRWQNITPDQEARLAVSFAEMQAALRAVRRLDRSWKPTPQFHETVEGEIAANNVIALEARFRAFELTHPAIGPGPYARKWMTAPSTNRRYRKAEQEEVDRLGNEFGCHRCGEFDPKTHSGRWVGDHQMPKSLGTPTRIYPHCKWCSDNQGKLILRLRKK